MTFAKTLVMAAWAAVATAAHAQSGVPDGRWSCVAGGRDLELTIAGDTATVAFAGGERHTLRYDPARSRPFYTDGKVALRMSGGGPMSTRGPEWITGGDATSVTRCVPVP